MLIGFIGNSEWLQDILGMSLPCAMLIICLILLVIDMFFFGGDGLTYIVHVLLTLIMIHYLPITNWLWLTLIGLFIYGGILALHFLCWRIVISRFFNHVLAPDRIKTGNEALLGCKGVLRNVDGRWVIHIGEEWIACKLLSQVDLRANTDIYGVVTGVSEEDNLEVTPQINKDI